MKGHKLFVVGIMLIIAAFLIACTRNEYPTTPAAPVAPVAPIAPVAPVAPIAPVAPVAPVEPVGQTLYMDISNFRFADATVKVGDTVVWTNQDTVLHTVTSDTDRELDSLRLENGQTYSHTFTATGVYAYHCTIHPSMKAKVTVT